jgi:hypothetical protein
MIHSNLGGIVQRLFNALAHYWEPVSTVLRWSWTLAGGALMGWAAAVTDLLQPYAPFSWIAAGVLGAVAASAMLGLLGWFRAKIYEARYLQFAAVKPDHFNRIEGQFTKQKIALADLIHPLGEPLIGKIFVDCEFYGPGIMGLSGCAFEGFGGGGIELMALKSGTFRGTPNKAVLINCHFRRCKFYNVIIAMSAQSVDDLNARLGGRLEMLDDEKPDKAA